MRIRDVKSRIRDKHPGSATLARISRDASNSRDESKNSDASYK